MVSMAEITRSPIDAAEKSRLPIKHETSIDQKITSPRAGCRINPSGRISAFIVIKIHNRLHSLYRAYASGSDVSIIALPEKSTGLYLPNNHEEYEHEFSTTML